MKEFLKSMFGSGSEVSSKRVITFVSLLLFAGAFILNLFLGYVVEQPYLDVVANVIYFGIGAIVAEKVISKSKKKEE
jgi:hypothetical protein